MLHLTFFKTLDVKNLDLVNKKTSFENILRNIGKSV